MHNRAGLTPAKARQAILYKGLKAMSHRDSVRRKQV
jgi:hypothetical protein